MNNNGTANYYKPGTTQKTSTELYSATTIQPSEAFTESQCKQLGTGQATNTYVWSKGGLDVSKKNGVGVWTNGSCNTSAMTSSAITIACDNFGIKDSDCKKYLSMNIENSCKNPFKWFDFTSQVAISKDESKRGFDGTSGCYTSCPSNGDMPLIADGCDEKSIAETSTKCALSNGVGFIICPLMWMMSAAIDSTYGLLSNILAIPSTIFSNASVLAAYNTFLPYANLVLAVVFLLIIYSEATGNGFGAMNNYSIKKTLPRLIIFAILINLSFYICAAAVDVSNIAGSSMYKLFTGTSSDFSKQLNKDNNFTTQAEKATGNENYGKDK
jgi:hypothetical protein